MTLATSPTGLALAAQLDAAGQHEEAVNALARGTMAGQLACMAALGKRLLVGDRAPLLPAEAARLLHDAARQGDADAAARMASLSALGLYFRQSWDDALRWLLTAAERGWQPAQAQLRALAGIDAAASGPAASDWGHLAGTLDLARWRAPAPSRALSVDPVVRVLDQFVAPSICDWMVARARPCLTRAQLYDPVRGRPVIGETRTNSVANFNLAQIELTDVLLQARMADACGVPMNHMEAMAALHYSVGEQAAEHYDFVDPQTAGYAQELARNGQRALTFLIYLNDDYEGGETIFPTLQLSHKGHRGQGFFFVSASAELEPDRRVLHAGRPPTRGEKWIISQFVRSRPTLVPIPSRAQYRAR